MVTIKKTHTRVWLSPSLRRKKHHSWRWPAFPWLQFSKRFQRLYIVILSKKQCPCIIYCWVTDYPNFSSLKQNPLFSHSFRGSGMWVSFGWVLWLRVSYKAAFSSARARHLKAGGSSSRLTQTPLAAPSSFVSSVHSDLSRELFLSKARGEKGS